MKLLGTGGSPYARKVRVVLAEKAIDYDYVIARTVSDEVAAANPLLQIPTLIRDDGRSLYDSAVIVEYLDALVPEPRLIPDAFANRIEVLRWQALGDGIMDATVAVSHDERHDVAARKDANWYARQERKIINGLTTMQSDLGEKAYCFGDTFSLADVVCGSALGYIDQVLARIDWRNSYPSLARHAATLEKRPCFRDTVPPPV
ncbi:MAG: glutathione S-transferase family protein [Rhodospirillales bacterium]|jgi:glutathione S-transferase